MSNESTMKMPYNPDEDMAFTNDRCFLCGTYLVDEGTEEHVFPKWLLNKYDLWNARIGLLNGTDIPYKQLTIPCCAKCNGEHLSQLEKTIASAAEQGYEGFSGLDEIILFKWIAKIFYGLQFRELSLIANRRDPASGYIRLPEQLKEYKFLHNLLQSVRLPYKFIGHRPWSIFLFRTLEYGDTRDFDYHDDMIPCVFSMRLGKVGIVAALSDHGAIKATYNDIISDYSRHCLHPMQFQQVAAEVHYNALLINKTPTYLFLIDGEGAHATTKVVPLRLGGYSTEPLFDDWDWWAYAKVLLSYWREWGYRPEDIITEDGRVWCVLRDENGDFMDVPADVLFASPITGKLPSFEPAPFLDHLPPNSI